jgi:hypothetical protein
MQLSWHFHENRCSDSHILHKRVNEFLPYFLYTVEPVYNDIGLYGTSSIMSDILCYQLIPHW